MGFPDSTVVKKIHQPVPETGGGVQSLSLGSEDSPGGGNGYPLQDSCLGNSMEWGAWQGTVNGVTESDTTEYTHINK